MHLAHTPSRRASWKRRVILTFVCWRLSHIWRELREYCPICVFSDTKNLRALLFDSSRIVFTLSSTGRTCETRWRDGSRCISAYGCSPLDQSTTPRTPRSPQKDMKFCGGRSGTLRYILVRVLIFLPPKLRELYRRHIYLLQSRKWANNVGSDVPGLIDGKHLSCTL